MIDLAFNRLNMNKKILMVIAPQNFRDEEYLEPRQALESGGVEVKVASLISGAAKGAGGTLASIDLLVEEARPEDFDGVLFVGGQGMAGLVGDERLTNLARAFFKAGKLVSAICIAPMILAKADLLKNKKATVWSGAAEDLKNQGANYQGEGVFVDGQIITGSGPKVAREFGEKILEMLK